MRGVGGTGRHPSWTCRLWSELILTHVLDAARVAALVLKEEIGLSYVSAPFGLAASWQQFHSQISPELPCSPISSVASSGAAVQSLVTRQLVRRKTRACLVETCKVGGLGPKTPRRSLPRSRLHGTCGQPASRSSCEVEELSRSPETRMHAAASKFFFRSPCAPLSFSRLMK